MWMYFVSMWIKLSINTVSASRKTSKEMKSLEIRWMMN